MKKSVKIMLFKIWAELLLILSALIALVIKIFRISPLSEQISWGGAILLTVIVCLYLLGLIIEKRELRRQKRYMGY